MRRKGTRCIMNSLGYPLESGWCHMLWLLACPFWAAYTFNNRLVIRALHGYRILHQSEKELSPTTARSPVKPKGKLIQIVPEMFRADGSVVRPQQPTLKQSGDTMHSGQRAKCFFPISPQRNSLMRIPKPFETTISFPTISSNLSSRCDIFRDKWKEAVG